MSSGIFISYSSKDEGAAEAVVDFLSRAGFSCWMAKRALVPGTDWTPAIVAALTTSRLVILFCSEAANHSRQVFRETQLAFENGIRVLPLKIDEAQLSAELRYYLGPVHVLDASEGPLANHLPSLVRAVQALLPTEPLPHPPKFDNAPGSVVMQRKDGWVVHWQCRADIATRGFKPKVQRLAVVTDTPTQAERDWISDMCNHLQQAMLEWSRNNP